MNGDKGEYYLDYPSDTASSFKSSISKRDTRPILDPEIKFFPEEPTVNFEAWFQRPAIKAGHAFILAMGGDPDDFPYNAHGHPLVRILDAAVRAKSLNGTISLEAFVNWAVCNNYPVHHNLKEVVVRERQKRQDRVDKWNGKVKQAVSQREFDTLQKILIAIATKKLGFDAESLRSEKTTIIEKMTESYGHKVSRETIRKALMKASEAFPILRD